MKLHNCLNWFKGKAHLAWGHLKNHLKCVHGWKGLALLSIAALAYFDNPVWDWMISWGAAILALLGLHTLLKHKD